MPTKASSADNHKAKRTFSISFLLSRRIRKTRISLFAIIPFMDFEALYISQSDELLIKLQCEKNTQEN